MLQVQVQVQVWPTQHLAMIKEKEVSLLHENDDD